MRRKRVTGLILMLLIIATNSMIVLAKTDSASRSFKAKDMDISGKSKVTISTGTGCINKANSSGSIYGSDLKLTSSSYYYTQVQLSTCYGTNSYKMYDGRTKGDTSKKGLYMWRATMRINFNGTKLAEWTVCCV